MHNPFALTFEEFCEKTSVPVATKTLVVAIDRQRNPLPNLGLLPPFINLNGTRVVFHADPITTHRHNSCDCNYDVLVESFFSDSSREACYTPQPVLRLQRYSKNEQLLQLAQVSKKLDPEIYHPMAFFLTEGRIDSDVRIGNYGIPLARKVVVKTVHGARGDEQALVPREYLNDLLARCDQPLSKLQPQFPDVVFTGNKSEDINEHDDRAFFRGNPLVVTEYIPGITHEYRVLIGGHRHLAYERTITEGAYPQANLDGDGVKQGEIVPKPLDEFFNPVEKAMVETLIKELNLWYGSLDLFRAPDGRLGVFEFSPEFGFCGIDPGIIEMLTVDYFKEMLTKLHLI